MKVSVKSLWGAIPSAEAIRTPYTVFREQAASLGELTDHILEGRVRRVPKSPFISNPEDFTVVMDIVAPAIDNYAFRLLSVTYPITTLYPARLEDVSSGETYECENEEVFVEYLGIILSSDGVRKAVQGLLSQSRAMEESS